MRLQLFTTLFCLFWLSCIEEKNNTVCHYVDPKIEIKSLLDSFVKVSGKQYSEYALYIDKTSPHNFDLIFYAGKVSLTSEEDQVNLQKPIQKTLVDGVEFKIYSGVEHFFQTETEVDRIVLNKSSENKESLIWAVKDSFGIISIYKVEGAYPFIALPVKRNDSINLIVPSHDSSDKN